MIRLTRLADADLHRLAHLSLAPEQRVFVGDPAALTPARGLDVYAVEAADGIVGMFRIDCDYAFRRGHDFASTGDLGLRGLLIDEAHQGQGLGAALLAELPAMLARDYPQARRILLTVNLRNPRARRAYAKAGWRTLPDLYLGGSAGPQHVMALRLCPV